MTLLSRDFPSTEWAQNLIRGFGPTVALVLATACGTPAEPPVGPMCGGIAGIQCPDGLTCVDDPSDECSPEQGGADCGGVCVAKTCSLAPGARYVVDTREKCLVAKFACEKGEQYFANDCGCGCEPIVPVCTPKQCGPALGMPNRLCPDGVNISGPTGQCLPTEDGSGCAWEIATCPKAL